jgi:hypothetical protein
MDTTSLIESIRNDPDDHKDYEGYNEGWVDACNRIMACLPKASTEPIQIEPNDDQLRQIMQGLSHCFVAESKRQFLRQWIKDWTRHKLAQASHD